jgi:preprotein translocase subunit SecA
MLYRKNIRGERSQEISFAFVDEVDNMFIDNCSTLAIISTPT